VGQRFREHIKGEGSQWTRIHAPVRIETVYEGSNYRTESEVTKKLMEKHGIEKVRGGPYSSPPLSPGTKGHLTKEIRASKGACFTCGKLGHYAAKCAMRQCHRCGRISHVISECYARRHLNGLVLSDSESDSKDGYTIW
jgi:hypothetical protein